METPHYQTQRHSDSHRRSELKQDEWIVVDSDGEAQDDAQHGFTRKYRQCATYESLTRDLKMKRDALCNDAKNAPLCDCVCEVGAERQRFNVVSFLFAMVNANLAEVFAPRRDRASEVIVLEDITPICFSFLREYFYCLNPDICADNAPDILYAAKKWNLTNLGDAAQAFILSAEGVNDSIAVISRCHELGFYELSLRILFENRNFEQAMEVFQFDKVSPDALRDMDHKLLTGVLTTASFEHNPHKALRDAIRAEQDRIEQEQKLKEMVLYQNLFL